MVRQAALIAAGFLCVILLAVVAFFSTLNVGAIPDPGSFETYVATVFRRNSIRKASRAPLPTPPANSKANVDEGDTLYGTECAACHGLDGFTPTDAGRWMYPRAADLTSNEVQRYSDRELFWIISNGIRLSGMPAFAPVETNDHMWDLVYYLRMLRRTPITPR